MEQPDVICPLSKRFEGKIARRDSVIWVKWPTPRFRTDNSMERGALWGLGFALRAKHAAGQHENQCSRRLYWDQAKCRADPGPRYRILLIQEWLLTSGNSTGRTPRLKVPISG
jgi:hypothetical protein